MGTATTMTQVRARITLIMRVITPTRTLTRFLLLCLQRLWCLLLGNGEPLMRGLGHRWMALSDRPGSDTPSRFGLACWLP